MVRGLYTSYTGMLNEQYRLDIMTNNLANASTVGYKEENVANQSFHDFLTVKIRDESSAYDNESIGKMNLGVRLGEVYTDYTQGSLRQTENPYDLAIEGDGFFQVKVIDRQGNESIKYTRDGSFKMTQDGYLVDTEGNRLQGEGGDIQIPTDSLNVSISSDGSVMAGGAIVNTITLADFENYDYIEKYGDNLYNLVDGAVQIETTAAIRQGFTEQSNVNVVSEMVDMITITRAYEANQKVMKTIDTMLEGAVNSVGKV